MKVFKQFSNKFVFNKLLFRLFQSIPPRRPGPASYNRDALARHLSRPGGLRGRRPRGPGHHRSALESPAPACSCDARFSRSHNTSHRTTDCRARAAGREGWVAVPARANREAGGKEARSRGKRRRRTLCTPPRATPLTENWEAGLGGGVRRPPPWAPPRPPPPRPPRPAPTPAWTPHRPAPPGCAAAHLGASPAGRFFGFPFGL